MSRRRLAVAAAVLMLASLTTACGGSDDGTDAGSDMDVANWQPEWVDGKLKPLPDGFPEREMTIIVADNATSAEAIMVRHLQEALKDLSPVAVELEAREEFEAIPSWEALAYIKDEDGGDEGYIQETFGSPGGIADLVGAPVKDVTGLTIDDLQEVISGEDRPYFVSQCANVAWEPTMQSLVDYTKANPGKVRFMAGGAGAAVDVAFMSYMKALGGGEVDMIPVGNTVETATATAACEGDVTVTPIEPILPHVQAGRLDVLMVSRDKKIEQFPKVPTAAELGIENDPMGSTKQIVVPSTVPELHVRWLYELYAKAMADPEYVKAREEFPGLKVNVRDPQASDKFNRDALAVMETILRDLGLAVEQ
jgi:tripartite-type tricarboxylate transporter receptor subunit TctC